MIAKEKIIKLLASRVHEDRLLGLNYLKGMSMKEIIKYFKLTSSYDTIVSIPDGHYGYYKISEDCIILFLSNVFPIPVEDRGGLNIIEI